MRNIFNQHTKNAIAASTMRPRYRTPDLLSRKIFVDKNDFCDMVGETENQKPKETQWSILRSSTGS
jgi:hypothetical protein